MLLWKLEMENGVKEKINNLMKENEELRNEIDELKREIEKLEECNSCMRCNMDSDGYGVCSSCLK